MSIQRDPSAAQVLLYAYPQLIPSGSPVTVGEGDSLVMIFDDEPRDVFGQGVHYAYSPSYRKVRGFFVRTGPSLIRAGGTVAVKDARLGVPVRLRYAVEVWVQAADPRAVAAVGADGPTEQASQSVDRLIGKAVSQALEESVATMCLSKSAADVVNNPASMGELAAQLQPALQKSGVRITGVQVVNVGSINLVLSDAAAATLGAQNPAAAPAPAQFPIGDRVFAYWSDGKWYPAVIRAFKDGQYQVDWEGNPDVAWVPATHVRDDV